jgi:hypothetical protein
MRVGILRLFFVASVLCWLAAAAQAQAGLQTFPHLLRPEVSSGRAVLVGSLPAERRMNLSFVLPLRNQAELSDLLNRLYDPASPDYHHFLSVEEFTQRFGPTAEDFQAAVDFAQAHGLTVTGRPANRRLVSVSASVAQMEEVLHARMNLYRHPTEGRNFYSPDRAPALDLDIPLAEIAGLDNFFIPRRMTRNHPEAQTGPTPSGSGPNNNYLPSDLRAAYYGNGPLTGSGQVFAVFQMDGYEIADTVGTFNGAASATPFGDDYLLTYTPATGGATYTIPILNVLLDGMPVTTTGSECTLKECADQDNANDMAEMIGMASGISQVRQYIGNLKADVFNAIASENLAKQINCSYEDTTSSADASVFQEFAAQGQNIFISSGDAGAYPLGGGGAFWGLNPWITSVGGTQLYTNGAGGSWSSEISWSGSGGGTAAMDDPIPSWQIGVANSSNGASATQRNGPDVAAEASNTYGVSFGEGNVTGGTSFSAPRWAGFMALINQQAVAVSGSVVGFVNPALYQVGLGSNYNDDFHDIVSGNSDNYGALTSFYNAVPGYDLVTGWGSPNGQSLIDDLAALQPAASAGFLLSASPASLTVAPGATAATTIAIQQLGGFTGGVSLSVSGLPSGVTASFSKSATTGSSALTLTVGNSVSRGIYTIIVTGTSGALTGNAVLSVAVDGAGFSIAASPGIIMNFYNGPSNTITVTSYGGFAGTVALGAVGQASSSSQGNGVVPGVVFGSNSSIALTANGTGEVTLAIINLPAPSSAQASPARPARPWLPAGSAALACLLIFLRPARRRGWRAAVGIFVLLAALAGGVCACGGGGGSSAVTNPPPLLPLQPGTYFVTVTGTSGSMTASCTIVVLVK